MRGYFGIGVEGISKPMNLGTLVRSAHAFGASFVFTIAPTFAARAVGRADTSDAAGHVPLYTYADLDAFTLPRGCQLVGVELIDGARELPSFRHPQQAAYVLGAERGALSPPLLEQCAFVVRIPTRFCINLGIAGAIVMYDRLVTLGRFPARPVTPTGSPEPVPPHVRGARIERRRRGTTPDTGGKSADGAN
jgi:tRNA G18 (ribose-2'-O)-methylase SpoU